MPIVATLFLSMDEGGVVNLILHLKPSFHQKEYFKNHFFLT